MIEIIEQAIDVSALRRSIADPKHGSVLMFEGVGRDNFDGRAVTHLEYECYVPMALAMMREIAQEIAQKWPGSRCALVHRLGPVGVGEASIAIAVGTAHRAEGYEASRYAIDELKLRVPIWKKEVYADGSEWKANSPQPN